MGNRYYGLEIELENVRLYTHPPSFWLYEGDGSLRNRGMEFKSAGPLPIQDAIDSLLQLDDYFERNEMQPEANARCSVHIHMDVRDMSNEQVYNMLCNYSLIEPMFFSYVGGSREESHFCVPYYHCRDNARTIMTNIRDHNPDAISLIGRKYMALNVLPMYRWGSVEWRQFPATLPVSNVIPWLELINEIKTASLHGKWSDEEARQFVNTHMPGVYDEDLMDMGLETYYYHLLTPKEEESKAARLRAVMEDLGMRAADPMEREEEEDEIDFGDEEQEERVEHWVTFDEIMAERARNNPFINIRRGGDE